MRTATIKRLNSRGVSGPARDPHQRFARALVELPGRDVEILAAERLDDVEIGQTVSLHLVAVEQYLDLAPRRAHQSHLADARDILQPPLQHFFGKGGKGFDVEGRRKHGDREDGKLVKADLLDDRLFHFRREQAADAVDFALHLQQRRVKVLAQLELDHHARNPFGRDRVDVSNPSDRVDGLLDALGHFRLHRLRRHARIRRGNADDRNVDIGEEVNLQLDVREDADDHQRHHHHGGEDGLPNGKVR